MYLEDNIHIDLTDFDELSKLFYLCAAYSISNADKCIYRIIFLSNNVYAYKIKVNNICWTAYCIYESNCAEASISDLVSSMSSIWFVFLIISKLHCHVQLDYLSYWKHGERYV